MANANNDRNARTGKRRSDRITVDRRDSEAVLEFAERAATEQIQREAAAAAAERQRREMTAGLPALKDARSATDRLAALARRCGIPWFGPSPGKFGGFSDNDLRRITARQERERRIAEAQRDRRAGGSK